MNRRHLATGMAGVLLLAACGGGEAASGPVPEQQPEPVTLSLWHGWSADSEVDAFDRALRGFQAEFPWITVETTGGMWDDQAIIEAAAAGEMPDVAMSFTTDSLTTFCQDGIFENLESYLTADGIDPATLFPERVRANTEYQGVRCAMPMLADSFGLYYNRELLAGNPPPRTLGELTELTKELTVRDADGTIEVAGFVPFAGMYQNDPVHIAPMVGASWTHPDGTSAIGSDPAWRELFEWQQELIDWYGYDELQEFMANMGEQWTPEHPFMTGEVAMALDGEWRTAMIAADAPDLDYGTAPLPVSDHRPELYGSGFIAVSILGIAADSPHQAAAWELVKYLSTDTDTLVALANSISNLPTTVPALESPALKRDDHFRTFLDIFDHPHSTTLPPHPTSIFNQDAMRVAHAAYAAGEATDLAALLADVDEQINQELANAEAD